MDLQIRQKQRLASISYDNLAQAATFNREKERVGLGWGGKTLSFWLNQHMASCSNKRLQAIEALGNIGPAAYEAIPLLKEQLNSLSAYDWRLRTAIFDSLRLILRSEALPLFTKLLEHKNSSIREGAAQGLALLGKEGVEILEAALDNLDQKIRACVGQSLDKIPLPARRRMLRRLSKDSWSYCRFLAMEKLRTLGVKESGLTLDEIHSFIISEIGSDYRRNRGAATRAMGKLHCYSKVVLDAAHHSPYPRVRRLALRFSQDLPEERMDQLLVKMRKEDFQFRREVIRVLTRLPKLDKESLLEKIFYQENRVLQINVVLALGRIGTPKALETMRRLYATKHMRVKVQILEAVARLSARDQEQLSSQNSQCLVFFEKALKSRRSEIVRACVRALGYWRQRGALDLMEVALAHSNRGVRQTVLTTLASWDSCPRRTELLRRIGRDAVPMIASQASLLMRPPL